MHDIVIRGGTIVDGTGAPASNGDVAIDGDRIVQVGGRAGPGKREVKADGRLVTPPSCSAIAASVSRRFVASIRRR
jgi:N-acyl-D-aspartate/D-glutamate deacylase